ncbi:hypothetical protein ACE6H2_023951 [Prunus campanulata]
MEEAILTMLANHPLNGFTFMYSSTPMMAGSLTRQQLAESYVPPDVYHFVFTDETHDYMCVVEVKTMSWEQMIVENSADIDIPDLGKKKIRPKGCKDRRPCLDPPCLDPVYLREIRPDLIPVRISAHQRCLRPMHSVDIVCSNLSFHAGDGGEGCKELPSCHEHEERTVAACVSPWMNAHTRTHILRVILEKDARSDIPDMVRKKFLVPDNMPLGDFFNHIRFQVKRSRQFVVGAILNPIFMFFKNTKPPIDALMSAIYEENKDDDGYLHITYSGEESVCGSNEAQECMLCGRS